jgi:hypothetical protein
MASTLDILRQYYAENRAPAVAQFTKKYVDDERVKSLNGSWLPMGTGFATFDLDRLARWWLWRCDRVGEDQANSEVEAYLTTDEVTLMAAQWVFGLTAKSSVTVLPEIDLVPNAELPDSQDKFDNLDGSHQFIGPDHRVPLPTAALVKKVKVPKVVGLKEGDLSAASSNMKQLFAAQDELEQVSMLMNVLPGVFAWPAKRTGYSIDSQPFGLFGGGASGASMEDIVIGGTCELNAASEQEFVEVWKGFQAKSKSQKEWLSHALYRLAHAKGRRNRADRALELCIPLEMLLLKDADIEQLSLTFRLRGAWLLGGNFQTRHQNFNSLKEIYTIRSKVVHTGQYRALLEMPPEQYVAQSTRHADIAEQIFRRLICGPTPNWNELILGIELAEGAAEAPADEADPGTHPAATH